MKSTANSFWLATAGLMVAVMLLALINAVAIGALKDVVVSAAVFPSFIIAAYMAVRHEREVFHPISFLFLTVFFGITVQTFFLIYMDDGSHRFAVGKLTDENTILTAIGAVTMGVVALLAGFGGDDKKLRKVRATYSRTWSPARVKLAVTICMAIGMVFLLYYISVFNVLENIRDQFAVKRRLINEDTGVAQTLTWVRFGINFVQLAFFISFAAYLAGGPHRTSFMKLMVVVSGVASIVMPFIASSRLGLITFILGACMIHHFSTGGWPAKRFRQVFIVVVIIIVGMGTLRYVQSRGISFSAYSDTVAVEQMLEPILGSSNFLAVGKSAVVIEAVPSVIDYQYGRTYLLWIIAPIPRAFWPEKPIIRIGAVLGEAIFGTTLAGGVPPGIIGELFLNFGWFGIPFGMFAYGVFLKKFYTLYGRPASTEISKRVVYSSIIVFVAFTGLSADFSGMMGMTLQRLIPLLGILYFISIKGEIGSRHQSRIRSRASSPSRTRSSP